jgi:hypothetical protein
MKIITLLLAVLVYLGFIFLIARVFGFNNQGRVDES